MAYYNTNHHKPFSKTRAGHMRRTTRRAAIARKAAFLAS